MSHRTGNDHIVVLPSTVSAATSTGAAEVNDLGGYAAIAFVLDVTSAATDVGDTLNVFVQTLGPSGEWLDVVHFTEVLGNGGAVTHVGKIAVDTALTMYETGTALGGGAIRNILGNSYRVRWAIVDADSDASFTFSVNAIGMAA